MQLPIRESTMERQLSHQSDGSAATEDMELPPTFELHNYDKLVALPNNTNKTWWKDPGLRRLNLAIGLMFCSAAANGFDSSLINGLLILDAFRDVFGITETNDNATLVGLMIAALSFGGLIAFLPASYVSDRMGRRLCVGFGSAIMTIAAALQASFKGRIPFLITRVFLGIGLAFAQTAAPSLTAEIAHPRHRERVLIFYNSVWYWGSIVSAVATFAALKFAPTNDWAWRMPCIVQAFFPLVQTIGLIFVPESPRYTVASGKPEVAFKMLCDYHANGAYGDEMVMAEWNSIREALDREASGTRYGGFKEFFKTPGNRLRLFICIVVGVMIQWAGNGIISYYLFPMLQTVGITSHMQASGVNIGLQVWNALLAGVGAELCKRWGRRPLWLSSAFGMLLAFIAVGVIAADYSKRFEGTERSSAGHGYATMALIFVFFGCYDIAFTPLQVAYVTEILPYRLRSKGQAINWTVIFGAGCLTQFLNPIALKAIKWRLYFIYVGLLVTWMIVIYFTFPETGGRSLEDIGVIFDGEDGEGPQLIPGPSKLGRKIRRFFVGWRWQVPDILQGLRPEYEKNHPSHDGNMSSDVLTEDEEKIVEVAGNLDGIQIGPAPSGPANDTNV
ncbi:Lactose permease [Drechslerella dactyloides]|uniref:Lactose permease n=1 Tax=Drechslerella dactyloides TaxID=74499 RepID=A0AAD6IQA9_DREDA|nr:Lactose permease [Drechslerella dactyloides]